MSDDLEIGIAAGLDMPTTVVLSEDDKPTERRPGKGCAWALLLGKHRFRGVALVDALTPSPPSTNEVRGRSIHFLRTTA
jgi:hypothetical protein